MSKKYLLEGERQRDRDRETDREMLNAKEKEYGI